MPENIAIIGAGIMGSAIATRLLACGHHVAVFDLDAAKVAALVAKGATAAITASAAAQGAEYVILSLTMPTSSGRRCSAQMAWPRQQQQTSF